MKIALINVYYAYGSTGKSVKKNYDRLKSLGHDVKVFYGSKKQYTGSDDHVFFGNRYVNYLHMLGSRYLGLEGALSNVTTSRLIGMLKKYKPDVVWLSGLHGYYVNWYRLINYLKKANIRTVYSMVDEYAFCGKCASSFGCEKYKTGCGNCPNLKKYPESLLFDNSKFIFNRKKKAYDGWENVVFRSAPYVVEKAKDSLLLKDKQFYSSDSSVDVSGRYYPRDPSELRKKLGIPEDKKVVLLCASSTDPHKGAGYFLECARLLENEDTVFIQVAYNGQEQELPSNFIPVSFVSDPNELAEYYSLADVYLCTSISDAQPNACIEALGCGTPIIGFNVSGVPYIAPSEFGTYVEPFDVEKLADAVRSADKKTAESIRKTHEYAKNRYDISLSDKKYAEFVSEYIVKPLSKEKEI